METGTDNPDYWGPRSDPDTSSESGVSVDSLLSEERKPLKTPHIWLRLQCGACGGDILTDDQIFARKPNIRTPTLHSQYFPNNQCAATTMAQDLAAGSCP